MTLKSNQRKLSKRPAKLKLVFSVSTNWWNAEAAYALHLADALQEAGHHIWVITPPVGAHSRQLAASGIPQLSLPHWPYSLWAAQRLRNFLRQHQVDIMQLFCSPELPLASWAVRGLPTHLIRTRGNASATKSHAFNRYLLKRCDLITASSFAVQQDLLKVLAPFCPEIPVIYYPASSHAMPSPATTTATTTTTTTTTIADYRQRLLQTCSLPKESILLALVGRLAPEKGHLALLQALPPVCKAYPQLAVLFLNKDQGSPKLRHQLHQSAQRLGISNHIHWLGWQKEITSYMAAVDLGIIPSLTSEVNCRIAMEFLAVKTPIIAFPTGSIPEVLEHKVTAWITDNHQPQQLTKALLELLAQPQQRNQMAKQGALLAQGRLSKRQFLQAYLNLYQQLQVKMPQSHLT